MAPQECAVPIVDFSKNDDKLAAELYKILRDVGCCCLINTGIWEQVRQFFKYFVRERFNFWKMVKHFTLQELKLQGIKIRDGVVFSRYSLAQCFAMNLSNFSKLPKCLFSSDGRASDL